MEGEPAPDHPAEVPTDTESQPGEADEDGEGSSVVHKVRNIVRRITAARPSPHPRFLHTLASILEEEEAKFEQEGQPNARSTHMIGRIANLIKENDEFHELISSKLLVESRYSVAVQAAAARLLLACMLCGIYPEILEERVVANIKVWVVDDGMKYSFDCQNVGSIGSMKVRKSDWEMLRAYSSGLLASSLSAGGGVVEEVLTSGIPAKLMHYLRIRVLKEAGIQTALDSRINSVGSSATKNREDARNRGRLIHDTSQTDSMKLEDEVEKDVRNRLMKGQNIEVDSEIVANKLNHVPDTCIEQGGSLHDVEGSNNEKHRKKHMRDVRYRGGTSRLGKEVAYGEASQEQEASKCRGDGILKIRGKSKALTSSNLEVALGSHLDKSKPENVEVLKKEMDGNNLRIAESSLAEMAGEFDGFDKSYIVGDLDISVSVRKAGRAAEAEARAANAPLMAVKAAGEAAVELVKTAAVEALANSGDTEIALAAAAAAAASVVDAALMTKTLRKDVEINEKPVKEELEETGKEGSLGELADLEDCIPDAGAISKLQEQFCIKCLEKLGEYLEVLGPVLHERGVDVCLALLQRESGENVASNDGTILSDVLKLICTLAAHRKFATLFVDRGGVQQLLAVPRLPHTFMGISLCLFALASLQAIMERVCTLPPGVVNSVVALALYLLECPQDSARRNAALFFGAAFTFRAILDAFDSLDGLSKMLDLLRNSATLRSGGSRNERGSSAEVLTSSEKQITYHTCIALCQFFRAHLFVLVDSLRPSKGGRGSRNLVARTAYKPLDLNKEALENLLLQLQRDRKLGPAFVRARWPIVEKFINCNGHLTLLELTQVTPGEKYLYEMAQYALNVLHIVTLMPYARKHVVSCTLSNERSSMAVILDVASASGFGDPEAIQSALLVLENLVCPPPSLCSRPPADGKDRAGRGEMNLERNMGDRNSQAMLNQSELRDRSVAKGEGSGDKNGESSGLTLGASPAGTVVGDRRISLGTGAGGSGLAAYMEQGYRQAREAVRANNGIKVLLHLLHPRTVLPPASLDCIRVLTCRVFLGLAKDDAIAHILTKLQVGKLLSELLRDNGGHIENSVGANGVSGGQSRKQTELGQVAMELMAIVTNAGRASTLVASDAAAPTLRRIERAAIAAATPISYDPRELLHLIHQHLLVSGMTNSAAELLKEAHLAPLPSSSSSSSGLSLSIANQSSVTEHAGESWQWPTGRVAGGFMMDMSKQSLREDAAAASARKRGPLFSPLLTSSLRIPQSVAKENKTSASKKSQDYATPKTTSESADNLKSPFSSLPLKRKASDMDTLLPPLSKRAALIESSGLPTPYSTPVRPRHLQSVEIGSPHFSMFQHDTPKQTSGQEAASNNDKLHNLSSLQTDLFAGEDNHRPLSHASNQGQLSAVFHGSLPVDNQSCPTERASLDNLVLQYLKQQHRQCPAPITTLPPLSLFHPHVCPEPSRVCYAPFNTASRLAVREACPPFGGSHGRRRDRHFVYSRFRPWRICRDDSVLLTSSTFLGSMFRLVAGGHAGDLRIFDCSSGNVVETHVCHQSAITLLQSAPYESVSGLEAVTPSGPLLLTSASFDVRLWNSSSLGDGALHIFDGCKSARFNHTGDKFAAIKTAPSLSEASSKEVLLYDIESRRLEQRLSDNLSAPSGPLRGHAQSIIHFSPCDTMLLWNGVVWDHRVPRAIHRFDQFTDYGGGGFHPAGNEVIINSEVWDLRSFKLLRSVPSLDQTIITFNSTGDVIYAILRRNSEDIMSALHPRRSRHPLFAAFRTMDAVDYTDIATTPVDRCILDLATEKTDSLISIVGIDGNEEMDSIARLYEVGRRRSNEDDSDPDDDVESEDEEDDEDDDSEGDEETAEDGEFGVDGNDTDLDSINDEDDASGDNGAIADFDSNDDDDDDGGFGVGNGILDIISDGDDDEELLSYSSGDDSGDDFNELIQGFF